MLLPSVYGAYDPEQVDDCFTSIAKACDDVLADVLTYDLDGSSVDEDEILLMGLMNEADLEGLVYA